MWTCVRVCAHACTCVKKRDRERVTKCHSPHMNALEWCVVSCTVCTAFGHTHTRASRLLSQVFPLSHSRDDLKSITLIEAQSHLKWLHQSVVLHLTGQAKKTTKQNWHGSRREGLGEWYREKEGGGVDEKSFCPVIYASFPAGIWIWDDASESSTPDNVSPFKKSRFV